MYTGFDFVGSSWPMLKGSKIEIKQKLWVRKLENQQSTAEWKKKATNPPFLSLSPNLLPPLLTNHAGWVCADTVDQHSEHAKQPDQLPRPQHRHHPLLCFVFACLEVQTADNSTKCICPKPSKTGRRSNETTTTTVFPPKKQTLDFSER